MFAYCTERLHLSEAEAYLRIAAARASRQHPILLAMLADGRLHLTAIAKLAPHLTPDNREAVLARATHCSKRQVEELAAELAPRPDAPALIRKLPEPLAPRSFPDEPATLPRSDRRVLLRLRPDELPHSTQCSGACGRDEATGSSCRTPSRRSRPFGDAPARLPRRASSRSPQGATAASSPPAPGCATSSGGSRRSCAPPSPAPTSPPSSTTPSPRRSRGARPAASGSRAPRETLAERDEACLAPHPSRRPPGRARAGRGSLSLRGRAGPTVHGPPLSRVPPPPPVCHGW